MSNRELQMIRDGLGIAGRCTACTRYFLPNPELRRDEADREQELRDAFAAHECEDEAETSAKRDLPQR
jgi:hypothetical protein